MRFHLAKPILSTALLAALAGLAGGLPHATAQGDPAAGVIAQPYWQKAVFLRGCSLPGLEQVRAELERYVASVDSELVGAALREFDQALAPDRDYGAPQCGQPERMTGSLDRRIEAAKAQFQEMASRRRTQAASPVAAPVRAAQSPQLSPSPQPAPPAAAPQPGPQPAPAGTPPASVFPDNEFTNDPRLAGLPENVRAATAHAASQQKANCETNHSLMNAYDCACYAGKVLESLAAQGGPDFGNGAHLTGMNVQRALKSTDMRACLDDAKLTKFFSEKAEYLLRRSPRYASRADTIKRCAVEKSIEEVKKLPQFADPFSRLIQSCINP